MVPRHVQGCFVGTLAVQLAHLREHLAPYKRPARIIAIDELPVNANGKVMKRELQARLEAEQAAAAPASATAS